MMYAPTEGAAASDGGYRAAVRDLPHEVQDAISHVLESDSTLLQDEPALKYLRRVLGLL